LYALAYKRALVSVAYQGGFAIAKMVDKTYRNNALFKQTLLKATKQTLR
jgi:hypothetical protein